MKGFLKTECTGFSISLDEIYLVRAPGILQVGDKKVIMGLEDGAVEYDPNAAVNIDYRKLARCALLALSVPQDASAVCEPFHVRIGGADAHGEKDIGVICTDASAEYAEEKEVEFYGCWVDAIGKCAFFVWSGLIAAHKGEKKYPVGIDYYNEIRNMRNAASFLSTAFPWGGRVWVNFAALLHCKSSVLKDVVCVTDVYCDKLADAAIDPSAFTALDTSGEPMDSKLGTGVWLLCMKLLQLAVDDRQKELRIEYRVMLLWLALFVADSFVLHPVVQRNMVACILGYLFVLAFQAPRAPWRCSTHMQEYYHGLVRTVSHQSEFTPVEFLRILRTLWFPIIAYSLDS